MAFIAGALGQGGAERQLFHVAATLRQCGAQVRVLSLGRGEFWARRLREAGVEISYVGDRPIIPLRLIRILEQLGRHRPDVVQSSHFFANPYALVAAQLVGAREVGAINSTLDRELQKPDPITARINLMSMAHFAVRSRAAIHQAVQLGIPGGRLHHRPAVVDTEQFAPRPRASNGVVRILAVGRMVEVKRHDRFLRVLATVVRRTRGKVVAEIAGAGPLRQELESQAARLGLSACVHFLGLLDDSATAYQNADLLLHTSDAEGLPGAVVEAMATALPVVATRTGDLEDLVNDTETGYLCESTDEDGLADRVVRLVDDAGLRRRMGDLGRQYVEEHHSLKSLPARLERFYQLVQQ